MAERGRWLRVVDGKVVEGTVVDGRECRWQRVMEEKVVDGRISVVVDGRVVYGRTRESWERLEDERESWEGGIDGREGELGESGRGIGRLQIGGWEGVVDGRE